MTRRDARGSALLISIMMVFIMTILGLALFQLGVIEDRGRLVSQADAALMEIVQAGLQRAVFGSATSSALTNLINSGDTFNTVTTFPTFYSPPLGLTNTTFAGGSYGIRIREVNGTEANGTLGLSCIPDTLEPAVCANIASVRVIATLAAGGTNSPVPPGYTTVGCPTGTICRMVQVLVRADSTSPFATAVTAATPGSSPIRGLVAGSINFLACTTCNAFQIDNSSSYGQRNHYADLAGDTLLTERILLPGAVGATLQLICRPCPGATTVESLRAQVKISAPTASPAVIATGAILGQTTDTTYTATVGGVSTTRTGKGPIDAALVADGCSSSDCSDNFSFGSGADVNVDDTTRTKPYPRRPGRTFPLLTDNVIIGSGAGTPIQYFNAAGGDFYATHAHMIGPTCVGSPSTSCAVTATGIGGGATCGVGGNNCPDLNAVFSLGFWDQFVVNAPPFNHDFTYRRADGTTINGRMCWSNQRELLFAGSTSALPAAVVGGINNGTNCTANLTTPSSGTVPPVMLYVNNDVRFGFPVVSTGDIKFRGAGMILANGSIGVDVNLINGANSCGVACTKFPTTDFLALMATGNINIGLLNSPDRVMGLFYTQGNFTVQGSASTRIVGAVAANQFCLARGCGSTGEAKLFEVTLNRFPAELFPGTGRHWEVSFVPKSYQECKNIPSNLNLTCG